MPFEVRVTSLFMPFSYDFYIPIKASSLLVKPLSSFIELPTNPAKFVMVSIVWDSNPTHCTVFDLICNMKTPINYEINGIICSHGYTYNAFGRSLHDDWKSFNDGRVVSWNNLVWGVIGGSFYPVVVILRKCDRKSADISIRSSEMDRIKEFSRLQDERVKLVYTESFDKDRKTSNIRPYFTEYEDHSRPEETKPLPKDPSSKIPFPSNPHDPQMGSIEKKAEERPWEYKSSKILTEVPNDHAYSYQNSHNNSRNNEKINQNSYSSSQSQSKTNQSTFTGSKNQYFPSQNSFASDTRSYHNERNIPIKDDYASKDYNYKSRAGGSQTPNGDSSSQRYSRWVPVASDNYRDRKFYSTGPEGFYKPPTQNEGYSTSRNFAEDFRSSGYTFTLSNSESKTQKKNLSNSKYTENPMPKNYYSSNYDPPSTPPCSKPEDRYHSAQKNLGPLYPSSGSPQNLNKTFDNFPRNAISPPSLSFKIENSNKEQMPEIKLTGLKTPTKSTPLRHPPVTQEIDPLYKKSNISHYNSSYEQKIPLIKSEEIIKHSFSDWKCPKCTGINISDAYECTSCRYINWERFYAIKADTGIQRSESIPVRGVENSESYKKNWRASYETRYTDKNYDFKGLISRDVWSEKKGQNIFNNEDRRKVPAFAYNRYNI